MKHLLFKIAIFTVFSTLILLSDTPYYIKIIFMSVMLFFLLPFRYEFFTKERMVRKTVGALGGAAIFTALLLFLPMLVTGDLWNPLDRDALVQGIGPLLLILIIALFGFFIYGLPASLLSDWLAARYIHRLPVAGIVHIGFGLLLIGELSFIPVICAVIFWGIDEILQRRTGKNVIKAGT